MSAGQEACQTGPDTTFNHGVAGSSPAGLANKTKDLEDISPTAQKPKNRIWAHFWARSETHPRASPLPANAQ